MISGSARIAGVFGHPVTHSRSPLIHNTWLARYNIDGAYVPMNVNPENIEPALAALAHLGFRGANVTIPFKETAFRCAKRHSPAAIRAGAVNTLIVEPDGTLFGDNTDGYGFMENLRQRAPEFEPTGRRALVIGAGGAARSICAALLDTGNMELVLVNRSRDRAESLAEDLGGAITVVEQAYLSSALGDIDLLVNTTSLGMNGQPPLDIDLADLPSNAVIADIVYTPLETPLLAEGRRRGHTVVDGLGMLLHQARPGFRAWFGVDPAVDDDLWKTVVATL